MFREMRRKKQQLSPQEALEILTAGTSGVLAVAGDGGYPYAVPISYACRDGKLYFHCALQGHKLDAIQRNERVSFCVIAQDDVVPQAFLTRYRSVIVFGRARLLQEDGPKRRALELLAEKYSPGFPAEAQREIEKDWERVGVVEISIEHITGKAARDLVGGG